MAQNIDILIPALASASVLTTGSAILLAKVAKRKAIRKRLEGLTVGLGRSSAAAPGKSRLLEALGRLGHLFSRKSPSSSLRQDLANAGYHGTSASAVYIGAKILLLCAGLASAGLALWSMELATHLKLFLVLVAGGVLFFVPNIYVRSRRRRRTLEVRHHLPDAVDLLEICVASGMGLDMAWNSVADEIRGVSTTLADEMALTNLEIHLGAPRGTALRHMAERTGVSELSSLVSLLVQSDRFGTSVGETLRVFAESMREERSLRAQEAAEKMAVKLLFPMVLFIFPAVLVVLVGPAAIQLFHAIATQ